MSGIFGYIGTEQCREILINGISSLEKRGSDTTGIVLKCNDDLIAIKTKGTAADLKQKAVSVKNESTAGIAQCDRAMRCKATQLTAKPACNNLFAAAMDGAIENFDSLKRWTNNPFPIATDEDLMLAMLCVANNPNKLEIIKRLDSLIEGSPSYAFIGNDDNAIYCKAGSRPLVIGMNGSGFYIASELNAIVNRADRYIFLDEGECARITADRAVIFDSKYKKIKKPLITTPEELCFENNYSIKDEIFYCPLTVKETYQRFVQKSKINFDCLKLNHRNVDKLSRIIITGTGCSYNTAEISAYNFSMLTDIPAIAYPAGELRYSGCVIDKNTLLIAISHRGESEDTIACAKRFKTIGAKTIAVTSNELSYLARLCDSVVNPNCDFEANEVSLRSFISNYLAMCFLALHIGSKCSVVNELYLNVAIKMAEMLPGKVSSAIKPSPLFDNAAGVLSQAENVFVTGLGADYALSLEGADKLRKIAKINASAYCVSELVQKCPTVLNGSQVIAFITNKELLHKALYSLRRAKALGAEILIITTENIEEEIHDFNNIISFNDSIPLFNPPACIAGLYKIAIIADEIKNKPDIEIAG